ncbi:MAG: YidC/Oxa1 family membrane protein insertase [Dethiobacteria bacterium]|jgi:YidC/Oxa1 family membrane protein insertase
MIQALSGYINIILSYFYNLANNNYGLAIIMLTVLVNIITFPLTKKQIESSKKLQDIQPELKRLQEKYKNDKEAYNRVTMEFMQKNKVNPLGGCLPLIVQFPIMIAVFTLLREPAQIIEAVEAMGKTFNPNFLWLDLTKQDPYYILPVLAAAATFFHQRMVITDPQQKMMLYVFPVMIAGISIRFPAGLVLYWFTNSIFSAGNQLFVFGKGRKKKTAGLVNAQEETPAGEQQAGQETISNEDKPGKKKQIEKPAGEKTKAPKVKKKTSKRKKKGAKRKR